MIPIRDTIPSRNAPLATWGLIAVNVGVFLFELRLSPRELEAVFYLFGVVPARYTHSAWAQWVGFPVDSYWPFLTSQFLHGGWMHLIGNMWTLWIFGDNVEDRMGSGRFVLFYLLAGVAGGAAHWLANPDSTVPVVGASGAIAGVLGAYFVMFPFSRIIAMFPVFFMPMFFEIPAVFYLLLWFLSQLFSGTLSGLAGGNLGGVAWWAHVGGFGAGIVLHRLFWAPPRRRARRPARDEWGLEGAWTRWD